MSFSSNTIRCQQIDLLDFFLLLLMALFQLL